MLFPLLFPFHFWLQFSFHLADSYLIYRSQLKHHFLQEAPYTHRLKVKVKSLSRVKLFETPWTVALQAPPSMAFPRQDTGVSCHLLFQGIFPTQGLNPSLLHCGQTLLSEPPGEPPVPLPILKDSSLQWRASWSGLGEGSG